jgi:hypothetical protein
MEIHGDELSLSPPDGAIINVETMIFVISPGRRWKEVGHGSETDDYMRVAGCSDKSPRLHYP